jgi:ABC-type transporter Mla subunit MlaD
MRRILGIIFIFIFMIGAGIGSYMYYIEKNAVTVLFTDAKGLKPGADVFMNGVDIGDVNDIELENEKVAAIILFHGKYRKHITDKSTFFINSDTALGRPPVVLVRNSETDGTPLVAGERIEGVDSFLKWDTQAYSYKLKEFMESEQVNKMFEDLKRLEQDFRKLFEESTLNEIEEQMRDDLQQLAVELEDALISKDVYKELQKINEKIVKLKQTLENVQESDEAQELKESLENLKKKVQENIDKFESS